MFGKNAHSVMEQIHGPFSFALFILGVRTTLDLTQTEMAKKLGITKAALCEIEKGRTLVATKAAIRYAKKVGFSETLALEACLQDQLTKINVKKRVKLLDLGRP